MTRMSLRRRHFGLLVVPFWTLFGAVSGLQIWISMIAHGHSLPRVVFYQMMVWNGWSLLTPLVLRLVRAVPLVPLRARNLAVHVGCALVTGFVHALWCVTLVLAIVPYDKMNPTRFGPQLVNVVLAYMPLEVAVYLLVALAGHAVDYYARYREREVQAAELERLLAEARLHALQLQIRPHFLFNTLNSISALVRTGDAAKAATMINRLSELLRYALERSEDQCVPLDDEIGVLRGYFEIQAVRFEDRLSWDIDVEPAASRGAVPVLLLQPLAENAVMHGIARSQAAGAIRVRARRAGEALEIEMFNTGRLLADDGEGIGLANTRARLKQLHGAAASLALEPLDGGVVARVTLPWSEA